MQYYILDGIPTPLARCRIGNRRVWDSQKHIKLIHGIDLAKQHNNKPFFIGPLLFEAEFVFEIPKRTPIKKRDQLIGQPYPYKPDLDNLVKYCLDVCTGVLYANDNIIVVISAKKVYGEVAKTIFGLRELHGKDNT